MRQGPKPAKAKVESGLPIARKSRKREGSRVQDLEKHLAEALKHEAEALEQQAAAAEILRVISSSPTNVQPVFDAIAASVRRLCRGMASFVCSYDGKLIHLVAVSNVNTEGANAWRQAFPRPPSRATAVARAIFTREVVMIPDVLADPEYALTDAAQTAGFRSGLAVPMLREGKPIGAIAGVRAEPGPFSHTEIELLKTFADQAVIAIANVQLFNETKEALEQQTATSEILHIISRSLTDVQPVFDAVAPSAARLCEAFDAAIFRRDSNALFLVAHHGPIPVGPIGEFSLPLIRGTAAGRTVLDGRIVHVADMQAEVDEFPESSENARGMGFRTILSVPLMREGVAIGTIQLRRTEAQLFTERQVALLQTFADQAAIAIENVRLFNELEARNAALTEALEQQTATSEILRVISSSPTDVQPVFDAIAESSARLCNAFNGSVFRFDGALIHFVAHKGIVPAALEVMQGLFPAPPSQDNATARAILHRAVVHIPDVHEDPEYRTHQWSSALGIRSVLSVPMLREGRPIGTITVNRVAAGPFSDTQVELLKTFADQAVIAIENVRLFKELESRNRELTEALEQQTATGDILKVISRSQTDVQPVFDAIADSALRLCNAKVGNVFLCDGEVIHLAAIAGAHQEGIEAVRQSFPQAPGRASATTRAIQTLRAVVIPDILEDPEFRLTEIVRVADFRSVMSIPMLRAGEPIGTITVTRAAPGPFSDKQIALLQTFADQAVIAIENVRLFKELQARTSELTRSVDELTALGEVSRALSSTLELEAVLDTIVTRANELAGTDGCSIYEYDEGAEVFRLRASRYADPREAETLDSIGRATPIPQGQGMVSRAAALGQPVQIPDIAVEASYESPIRAPLLQAGYRAILTVPLLLEARVIGALGVSRKTPGEFPSDIVRLLTTLASQSALAIQNARLFREIADKSRQLEVASQHKSEFLANMSHELRTPLNAVIGFSEVLSERMFGELNEKQEEYLKDIHSSGQHLLSLINDILDLSKIEAGRMELELTDFNLPTTLDNALTLVRERAGRHGIALHMSVDARLAQVRADERKFRQIVLNLLSNAIKFTPEGGRIEVRAVPVDGSVEVSVRDTGVGIAPEDQEAVFEEFRQVGTAAKKVEGTGLGLALSRKFVELHGGKIWVKSQVGMGSTFTFTLPLREVPSR